MDARQAFYAIIRHLILSVVETDQRHIYLFDQFNIPPAAMGELKTMFGKGPAMDDSILSDLIVRDIASTFTASHFEVRGSSKFGAAHTGTSPGHCYADVVFSFVSTKFQRRSPSIWTQKTSGPKSQPQFFMKEICNKEKM